MSKEQEICKNCESQFDEGFYFCPYCGQQAKEELTVGVLFYNTISNYFSFDARFLKSFFPLMFKPGCLAKRFIEGKRLLYLHPAQMYLFISVVFFFLLSVTVVRNQVETLDTNLKKTLNKPIISDSLKQESIKVLDSTIMDSIFKHLGTADITGLGINDIKASDSIKKDSILTPLKNVNIPGLEIKDVEAIDSIIQANTTKETKESLAFDFNRKKVDSLIALGAADEDVFKAMGMSDDAGSIARKFYSQVLKFYKQRNGGQILQAFYDTIPISLFVLLPIFALILKLFFRKRGSYAHHLVFSFYYFSFLFSVFSLILIINNFIEIPDSLDFLIVMSTYFYLLIAIKHFYQQGWFISFIKTGMTTFIYLMFVVPIALIIISLVSFFFY
ncbi:DUF3667 domain-containing protein [Hyunsoonleella aestuarii]|uniref:DUF3667 domain-containing protein n=1 Tax=Hyunsoonleella aestuarii TaxID=912802 RepID=A0ABP8EDP6_9FLAO|nr:DUF3667 domain-containing protein [Hyunsoonleella aestuarii]